MKIIETPLADCIVEAFEDGCVTAHELKTLKGLIQRRKPKVSLEFGTFKGVTTLNIADALDDDAKIFTINLPPHHPPRLEIEAGDAKYIAKAPEVIFPSEHPKIIQLWGDTASYNFSFLKGGVDFIFVDGAHSPAYVKNDSELALSLIRPGGMIVWHDYLDDDGWIAVKRYLNELHARLPLVRYNLTTLVSLCPTSITD